MLWQQYSWFWAWQFHRVCPLRRKNPTSSFIWGDDIGIFNLSAYNMGMMGYKTPNIDRLPKEGASSPTGMASRAAPPAARRSSPGNRRYARA